MQKITVRLNEFEIEKIDRTSNNRSQFIREAIEEKLKRKNSVDQSRVLEQQQVEFQNKFNNIFEENLTNFLKVFYQKNEQSVDEIKELFERSSRAFEKIGEAIQRR